MLYTFENILLLKLTILQMVDRPFPETPTTSRCDVVTNGVHLVG